jgi:DNA-binding beta-propeller fold protein YncE
MGLSIWQSPPLGRATLRVVCLTLTLLGTASCGDDSSEDKAFVIGDAGESDAAKPDKPTQSSGGDNKADAGGTTDKPSTAPNGVDKDAGKADEPAANGDKPAAAELTEPSRGAAVAIASDDSIAVVVNRDVGSVSVVKLDYPKDAAPKVSLSTELRIREGSEPWQVVIGPDDDTAYVVLRRDQQVAKLSKLHSDPELTVMAATGSEPTSLALSPSGKHVYVSNWNDGTVGEYDTEKLELKRTIDLNAALVKTGYLGEVKPRAALAHPRSIVITNDKDGKDDDESLFVTEYYAQQVEAELADGSNSDTRKVGLVYKVALGSGDVTTVSLKALSDIGFNDNAGAAAGCYPNQLQSIALSGNYAYVVSVCASPKGPLGVKATTTACTMAAECDGLSLVEPACITPFRGAPNNICVDVSSVKTSTAPVLSVIDTRTDEEVASGVNLNAAFAALYSERGTEAAAQRFPLFANDIAFVPGSRVGYVTANGIDAVFRFTTDATGKLSEVGASTSLFIDLLGGLPADKQGKNPVGIAVANGKKLALVANDVSRNVSLLDFNTQRVAVAGDKPVVEQVASLPPTGSDADKVLRGKRFFNTGSARWSLRGQGWGACQSCHGDGLSDNVTWYFARGPRQATALDGSFASKDPSDQRIFNWTAIFDQVDDFEGNTRDISGGVGAIVSELSMPPATADRIDFAGTGHAGLNGSSLDASDPSNPLGFAEAPRLSDWEEITLYMQTLRSPRAPTHLDPQLVEAGREQFLSYGSCNGCHSGEKWTISRRFYTPSVDTNTALRTAPLTIPEGFPTALLPATLPENQVLRFGGPNPAAFDQILCAIRPVGTFNVAESGVGIAELRADMMTVAQGDGNPQGEGRGYNIPSLLGVSTGAPYMHAGNVRTLEALFSSTFETHFRALAPNLLTETDPSEVEKNIAALVQYLLSIDEDATYPEGPAYPGAGGGSLCPTTFP